MPQIALIITALVLSGYINAQEFIRTIPPQSEFDASHDYYMSVLNLALDKSSDKYGTAIVEYSEQLEQGRAIRELELNRTIDIYFAGTNPHREKTLNAIEIPLAKGLLGFRLPVMAKDSVTEQLPELNDVKKMVACQGAHWPDSDILEHNGFHVSRSSIYELMWEMLKKGRCDYFPRGIHEGFSEVKARDQKYPSLALNQQWGIYYPFAIYFFVSKENDYLKKRIEEGLLTAIEDGSFEALMRNHKVTQHLFPLEKWDQVHLYILENPFLSKQTPINNPKLWYRPKELR